MGETAGAHGSTSGLGRKLAWGFGALVAGGVVPSVLVLLAIGAGMFVVAMLGLGEDYGVPTYIALFGCAALAYAAIIYGVMRLLAGHADVPWFVWPALLVAPLLELVLASPFLDTGSVLESPTAVPAFLGVAMAFVALVVHRKMEVAR